MNHLKIGGHFWGCLHAADGTFLRMMRAKNGIVVTAINDLLTTQFKDGTKKPLWYLGILGDTAFGSLSDADTIASHAGWQEFTTYSEATRQLWSSGTPASGFINNPTPAQVTITTGGTIKGAFLVSQNTKGGTTGTLWATGLWDSDSDEIVIPGQIFKFGYSLRAANG